MNRREKIRRGLDRLDDAGPGSKPRKGGRQKASEARKIIPINFAQSQVDALQALADRYGVPLSTYIRHAALRADASTEPLVGRIGLPVGSKS